MRGLNLFPFCHICSKTNAYINIKQRYLHGYICKDVYLLKAFTHIYLNRSLTSTVLILLSVIYTWDSGHKHLSRGLNVVHCSAHKQVGYSGLGGFSYHYIPTSLLSLHKSFQGFWQQFPALSSGSLVVGLLARPVYLQVFGRQLALDAQCLHGPRGCWDLGTLAPNTDG